MVQDGYANTLNPTENTKRMKKLHVISLILIIILLITTVTILVSYTQSSNEPKANVYVGIAFGGNTTAQAKLIIDKTKSYTNLFILSSGINPISTNQSAVEEVCDYAVNAGLNIIVNLGTRTRDNWDWRLQFYNTSKERYGDKFLGAYYDDEPTGIPFDWDWPTFFTRNSSLFYGESRLSLKDIHYRIQLSDINGKRPDGYTQEAEWYHQLISGNRGFNDLKRNNIPTFTSDYLLFWYDYLAGYDTLFAQIGWNHSINQDISLIRGAAKMQNKDWGAIITWKYTHPPYIDSPENIYNQMKTAYNAGAKYITLFNYPYNLTDNRYGILTEEHLNALERFWNHYITKAAPNSAQAEAALVLPKDYGWGMRRIDDKIWGFWGPDDKSPIIWEKLNKLISQHGLRLDIIYDDPAFQITGNYSKVYYWHEKI